MRKDEKFDAASLLKICNFWSWKNLEWEINNRKGKGNNNITTTTITKVS